MEGCVQKIIEFSIYVPFVVVNENGKFYDMSDLYPQRDLANVV